MREVRRGCSPPKRQKRKKALAHKPRQNTPPTLKTPMLLFFAPFAFLGAGFLAFARPLLPFALGASAFIACIVASFIASLAAMVCIFDARACISFAMVCIFDARACIGLHSGDVPCVLPLWVNLPTPYALCVLCLCLFAFPLALGGFSKCLYLFASLLLPFFPSPSLAVPFLRFIWLGRLTSDLSARALDV